MNLVIKKIAFLLSITPLWSSAFAIASADRLEINSDQGKYALFDYLEEISVPSDRDGDMTSQLIEKNDLSQLTFSKKTDGIHVLNSDHRKWYRIRLSNVSGKNLDQVLYNHFNYFIVDIRLRTGDSFTQQAQIGFGTPLRQDLGWFFPAHQINIPTGESDLYLGLHTNKHPASLNFEIRPLAGFSEFHLKYVVFVSCFLMMGIAIGVFNIFLFAGLRSKLHVYYLIGIFGLIALESCITGGLAILGPNAQANAGPLWMFALAASISGALLFTRTYFDITAATSPKLNRLVNYSIGGVIFSFLAYGIVWQYALPLVLLSLVVTLLLLGIVVGYKLKSDPLHASLLTLTLAPVLIAGGMYGFDLVYSSDSTRSNIFLCSAGMLAILGFSLITAMYMARVDRKNRVISSALGAVVPAMQVKKIIENRVSLNQTPEIRYITVMFVDIVGYSLAAKKHLPIETFNHLRELLGLIGKVVHQHGGIIDKSLGDGCLCFFGYDLTGSDVKGHEQTAVLCALEIQRRVVASINQAGEQSKVVFPLRIGINSADVCIGNIGDESRFDFTLTGDGVNLASRFETACEPFKVMIGRKTYDALDIQTRTLEKFFQRLIPVKHTMPLVETYEVNPFDRDPKAIDEARGYYWKSIDEQPRDQRYTSDSDIFTFHTNHGTMVLQNFSLNGYAFRTNRFLGKGVDISVDIAQIVDDPEVRILSPINVQVVWGVPVRDEYYMLGTRILGLNGRQREIIVEALRNHLAKTKAA